MQCVVLYCVMRCAVRCAVHCVVPCCVLHCAVCCVLCAQERPVFPVRVTFDEHDLLRTVFFPRYFNAADITLPLNTALLRETLIKLVSIMYPYTHYVALLIIIIIVIFFFLSQRKRTIL